VLLDYPKIMDRRGTNGVVLLFFFVVILMIGVTAAGVIVYTNGVYVEKMLNTHRESVKEATQSIDVVEIIGEDGSQNKIDYIFMMMMLGADSPSTSFNLTYFGLSLSNSSAEYVYHEGVDCTNLSSLIPGENYGIVYKRKGNDNLDGMITTGDVVMMCFRTPRSVYRGERFKIHIVTLAGSRLIFDYKLPDILYHKRTMIFP